MIDVPGIFASNVFNDEKLRERLPHDTYISYRESIDSDQPLDIHVANAVADAMKDWAIEKGCTHYTHWFQPMTGITAEKHDSFLTPMEDGHVMMEFSGKELIKGEPDASSFPSGGIRATFEARGYTTWDPTSPAFVKDNTLCIPTAFVSYTGDVLDKKTPLLRSMDRINHEAVRILHLFGRDDITRVDATVGPEQEYFLIDKEVYDCRKDLRYTGRTLFGARPPKGQQLDDHYFGAIKQRVKAFMAELDEELWKLGIYSKTEHNEVAPAQHELAPIFTTVNIAADHNQLTMELMKRIARKHGMVCLLHEKPFKGVNGSGKHNNWSLSTDTGENLLKPGKKPEENTQFLLFLTAVITAVDDYQDLLRLSVATAGNDHRLGGDEAPPAIISMFLGDDLEAIVEAIINGEEYESQGKVVLNTGAEALPEIRKDTTDRNRTSPFAFTGNKFEFRSLGSALNISCPNIMLNTMVADVLSSFSDELEKAADFDAAVRRLIRKNLKKHRRIIFNGDGYTDEWVAEAENRGLLNLKSTPDALKRYTAKKNIELFRRNHIFSEKEVKARQEILLENYIKIIDLEALTMLDMAKKDIFPAVSAFTGELAETIARKRAVSENIRVDSEIKLLQKLSDLLSRFSDTIDELDSKVGGAAGYRKSIQRHAEYNATEVLSTMERLREISDEMEMCTAAEYWPYPSYGELLFSVQS
ncbi:glutamine synthetase III [uncultured Ruminococcus sp.]|uniref:glutamine synthetase III family protein n=1 Tax=uncultured Ruminococcus sp. TaxID=165186 RepID=UPI0029312EA5|nr:glutamine synthetase III [uncultured Ruminococcus sp.]